MQSPPQCGAINNLSSTWTWLVISSLLGASGFLKQLHTLVGIWTFHACFLSDPGSNAVILYLMLANPVLILNLGRQIHPVALGGFSGTCLPGPSCTWGLVVGEQRQARGSVQEVLHERFCCTRGSAQKILHKWFSARGSAAQEALHKRLCTRGSPQEIQHKRFCTRGDPRVSSQGPGKGSPSCQSCRTGCRARVQIFL